MNIASSKLELDGELDVVHCWLGAARQSHPSNILGLFFFSVSVAKPDFVKKKQTDKQKTTNPLPKITPTMSHFYEVRTSLAFCPVPADKRRPPACTHSIKQGTGRVLQHQGPRSSSACAGGAGRSLPEPGRAWVSPGTSTNPKILSRTTLAPALPQL